MKKKFYILLSVFAFGFFVILAGLTYGAFQLASSAYTSVAAMAPTQSQMTQVAGGLIAQLQSSECIQKTQSLMSVEAWLAQSVADNITQLQKVCFYVQNHVQKS